MKYMKQSKTVLIVGLMILFLVGGLFSEREKETVSLEEQLQAALEKEKNATRKSPWHCISLVSIYLKKQEVEEVFGWLEKAVERGFLSYTELYGEEFSLLRKDKRFEKIITRIKDNIGIDKAAKNFTITLLSGEKFVLSKQKGKVVLIDFWATWCKPCVKGLPFLKKFYQANKAKGFEIVGISFDDKKKLLDEFMAKKKLPWPVSFSGKGWFDDTGRLYKVNLIPSYWLIDRKGVLRNFGIPLRDKETMRKALEKLLSE